MDTRTAVVMLMMSLPIAATAQAQSRLERAEAHAELRAALTQWAGTNVIPSLGVWKSKLDAGMTPTDLAALNDLRARARSLRGRFIVTALAMRKAWKDEDYTTLKANRDRMKGLQAERTKIVEDLKPIAERNRTTLESIGAEARPRVETWRDEARRIVQSWAEKHKDLLPGAHGFLRGMKNNGIWKLLAETRKKAAVARFMLWDGSNPNEEESAEDGLEDLLPELE